MIKTPRRAGSSSSTERHHATNSQRPIQLPVKYTQALEPPRPDRPFAFFNSTVTQYVVKADITAFYEYVDHGILRRELLSRTGDYAAIECLMSLLGDAQGRTFGLPQLLDSSDRLSEVYIDAVERAVLRRGWAVWRFNDDFRLAASDYGAALAAIEDLAAAARVVGLTLSDGKTTTPHYSTYLMDNFGLQVDEEVPAELHRHQVEEAVGDYTEGVGETDPTWAVQIVSDANAPGSPRDQRSESGVDLGNVRGDDFRILRRALSRLIRAGIADALPHIVKLIVYVPSLTPWALRYVIAAGGQECDQAIAVLDNVVKISLGDWQRAWVVRALAELNALVPDASGDPSARVEWVNNLRYGRYGPVVKAESALALASVGAVDFIEIEYALRNEPTALAPWYLVAIRRLHGLSKVSDSQLAAIRGEGGLYATLLQEQS